MKRYRILIKVELVEEEFTVTRYHRVTGRVLEFGDSKLGAERAFEELEREILTHLQKKERRP
jgi:hypothetical protein